jgi:hypothetical protein
MEDLQESFARLLKEAGEYRELANSLPLKSQKPDSKKPTDRVRH